MNRMFSVLSGIPLFVTAAAHAQGLSLPPSGDNQVSSVTQGIGLVRVTIDYSSPNVTGPGGEDRRGQIWGKLVPYGLSSFGQFGACGDVCPWRAGANENTVFTTSHDLVVESKKLGAGKYGVHMIPGEDTWTVIFSKNAEAWGSYSYNPKEDALRVKVTPRESHFNEWLTYEFIDRQPSEATVVMRWENLEVPIRLQVPNVNDLHLAAVQKELTGDAGFSDVELRKAARFSLNTKTGLKQGLAWAEAAVNRLFVGRADFWNLTMLASLQEANGMEAEARKTEERAFQESGATAANIHTYARGLLGEGKKRRAMEVFKLNAQKHGDAWPTHVGLGRGYSAMGDLEKAREHILKAVEQAPDDLNRKNLEKAAQDLAAGKPMSG